MGRARCQLKSRPGRQARLDGHHADLLCESDQRVDLPLCARPRESQVICSTRRGKADTAWHWTLFVTTSYASSYGMNKWLNSSSDPNNDAAKRPEPHLDWNYVKTRHPCRSQVWCRCSWTRHGSISTRWRPIRRLAIYTIPWANDPGTVMMPRVCIDRHGGDPAGSAPEKRSGGNRAARRHQHGIC